MWIEVGTKSFPVWIKSSLEGTEFVALGGRSTGTEADIVDGDVDVDPVGGTAAATEALDW